MGFLAFATQYQWKKDTKVTSFNEIEAAFEEQFTNKLNKLREQAQEALDNSNHTRFTELATLYLAIKEFNMPNYFEFFKPDFHSNWVGRGYAYKAFDLPKRMKKKSIGAPRKDRNADIRKHDFVEYVLNQFQSWAYKIYTSTPHENSYPLTIDIAELGKISIETILVEFKNLNEIDKLYKLLRKKSRVGILKNLQSFYQSQHINSLDTNAPQIWQKLNYEAGLYYIGEVVQESGLNKSLSNGKKARKTGKKPTVDSRSRYLPPLDGKWNYDSIFLEQKSIK